MIFSPWDIVIAIAVGIAIGIPVGLNFATARHLSRSEGP